MRRYLALICVVSICLCGCAAFAAINVSNIQTGRHVAVPGTSVMLVPPKGAELSGGWRGFRDDARMIRVEVTEIISPITEAASDISPERLASRGITDAKVSPAMVNGRKSYSAVGRAGETGSCMALLVGDERTSTLIIGWWQTEDREAERDVRACIMSVYRRSGADRTSSGQDSVGFKISTSGTPYVDDGSVNMSVSFKSDDGAAKFTVSRREETVSQDARMTMAREEFDRVMADREHELEGPRNVSVAGMMGVEIIARFDGDVRRRHTSTGARVRLRQKAAFYQLMLFSPKGQTFVLRGSAARDADTHLAYFKKMASSITVSR